MPFNTLSIWGKIQTLCGIFFLIIGVILIILNGIKFGADPLTTFTTTLTTGTFASGLSLAGLGIAFVQIGYNESSS